ncbi:uncharacterized protein EDB93DRAFT_399494 [Suillus bovinus]|uniref:uncharacterized protein n=1 Tax=Suillus bovinus TaxID=48563 RepID=UPI001B878AD0|nr:uncharacterized protein EDB93DRAFT_399494 [Suillus bovinus]KAG2147714.1 hypothetical protein EDB93DRAFT_399494 [Suillus bovinus]
MTLLVLYAVLFCVPFVCASLPSLNDTYIHTLDSSNFSPSDTRTLWDILLSCGLTLFACTWTAIHPNIPGVNDGVVLIIFYRLCLMVVALFIPEVMIVWAITQFHYAQRAAEDLNRGFGARRVQSHSDDQAICQSERAVTGMSLGDILNSSRSPRTEWTLTHGFFVLMGGFVLYVKGEPRATLTPSELLEFVYKGYVEMPVITEAEIEDRSKGDGLYKCIAILQLVWFVVQLIARTAQGLPVTLLEIDTLGVAALACIAYPFWWKKPKDIRRPYIVHWNSEADPSLCGNLENNYYYSHTRRSLVRPLPFRFDDPKYSPSLISFVAGCFSGVVFGAVHCLGWNVFLPHTEQILWRVASIGTTCSPLMTFFAFALPAFTGLLLMTRDRHSCGCIMDSLISAFMTVFMRLGMLSYICSRVTMLVLVFMSLRSLPLGAYDTIAWIKHISLSFYLIPG